MEMPRGKATKGNPDDEKNFGVTKRPDGIEVSMQKLTRKIFELELLESMARETEVRLREKEKEVMDERQKLVEWQYEKLERMEAFCDKIWKFSSSNDLCAVFNKYLDMPRRTSCKSVPFDIELDPEILKLKNENDKLKNQLANKKSIRQSLEENLIQSSIELKIAESYRENNPEIIRLKKSIEKLQENIELLSSKMALIEKEIFEEERQWLSIVTPIGDKKSNFVTATELIEKSKTDDAIKRPKFSVKRESAVSRKLANTRGANRSN